MNERLPYSEFEELVKNTRRKLEKKYSNYTIKMGDNNMRIGFWIDTKPYKTFVPLQTRTGLSIQTDYTTIKDNYKL